MRHQYGTSALVTRMSVHGETSDGVAKCWLFSQAKSEVEETYEGVVLGGGRGEGGGVKGKRLKG